MSTVSIRTGYARDSSAVAREAVKYAAEEGYDCVLIDTAGRMQVRSHLLTGTPVLGHGTKSYSGPLFC